MKLIPAAGAAAVLMATLAACSAGSPSPTSSGLAAGPAATGSPASTATSTPTSAAAGGHTATTTAEPCQLVTQQEASALTGASFGPGTERAIGPGKTCVYGGGTKNVFMVDVFQGSASEMQLVRTNFKSELAQAANGATVTPTSVSGLGDSATAYQVSDAAIFNASSIYVIKGTFAIYLVDEVTAGHAAPTTAALTDTARTAVGRMP
jgi:hypothetical protein